MGQGSGKNGAKIRTAMDGFYSGKTLVMASAPAIRSPVPDGLSIK